MIDDRLDIPYHDLRRAGYTAADVLPPSCLRLLFVLTKNYRDGCYPLSYRQMCEQIGGTGLSTYFISKCLQRLKRAGLVDFEWQKCRTTVPTCAITLYKSAVPCQPAK